MRRIEFLIKAVFARLGLVFCEERGCWEHGDLVHCRLLVWEEHVGGYVDEFNRYCVTHASKNGYCWACGEFWAGCESFDFNPTGLCSNCKDDPDFRDEWDDDAEYAGEIDYDPYP